MNRDSGWSTGFLKRLVNGWFWKTATLVRALNTKMKILNDDGELGFGIIGQSHSNVFWTISRRTVIEVYFINGSMNHISVWSTWLCGPCRIHAVTDHVTCFGQWGLSKCEVSRNLKSAPILEFVFSCWLAGTSSIMWEKHRLVLRMRGQTKKEVQL